MQATIAEYRGICSQTVAHYRQGTLLKCAMRDAARALGITERRIRAALYDEIRSVTAPEWISVRARFAQHLEAEARRHAAESELIRVRIAALQSEVS